MSVVLGFDTSLTISGCVRLELGVGAEGQVEPVRWEWWRARTTAPEQSGVRSMRRRIRLMLTEILALCPEEHDLAVVEGPAIGARHAALADERAGLRWLLIDQLLARGPVAVVPPKTRAILAGSGNARKEAVHAAASQLFPAAGVPAYGAGRFDVADAVVLAAAGGVALGMSWPGGLTAKQVSAHGKVPWPVGAGASSQG
ncbi:hypothetical protein [Microbacterium sp. No. 7]|uniref:hypothetical protein n=1 Tax=Microbacterium sp. No. 7 TaxID=1714373 RepID=UPI0006D05D9E|nr:hypothetical protein [Microbacterium sp. No. 7]